MADLAQRWTARLLAGCPGLKRHEHGELVASVAASALAAVDPRAGVAAHTRLLAKPKGWAAIVGEYVFDLAADPTAPGPAEHGRIWIFGAGKASEAMAAALVEGFGEHVAGGVVVVKHREEPAACGPVEILAGDHPVPGPRTAEAAARIRARAAEVGPRDLILCPISGGASALLSEPTLPKEDWAALVDHLLARDISIQAINRLRRRHDGLKAGGLARLLAPATVVGLILSDVVGDELALVGSGPTVYADDAEAQAYAELLDELDGPQGALDGLPERIRATLREASPPPPAPRDDRGRAQQVHQVLVARNGDAREAACHEARAAGLDSVVLLPALGGPAADEGRRLAALLREMPEDLPVRAPACLVTGGETTVDLRGRTTGARGGRNLELALAAVDGLAGLDDALLLTLATDGEDGPTDAAGAIVDGSSAARLRAAQVDVGAALAQHDSYAALAAVDDLLRVGATGTNVCDLAILFRFGFRFGSPSNDR